MSKTIQNYPDALRGFINNMAGLGYEITGKSALRNPDNVYRAFGVRERPEDQLPTENERGSSPIICIWQKEKLVGIVNVDMITRSSQDTFPNSYVDKVLQTNSYDVLGSRYLFLIWLGDEVAPEGKIFGEYIFSKSANGVKIARSLKDVEDTLRSYSSTRPS